MATADTIKITVDLSDPMALAKQIAGELKIARDAKGSMPWSEVEACIAGTLTRYKAPAPATPELVYNTYPRHVGRKSALAAIHRAIKAVGADPTWKQLEHLSPLDYLYERTRAYADAVARWPAGDRQFIPHPSTWFNQGRYADDPKEWLRGGTEPSARDYNKI